MEIPVREFAEWFLFHSVRQNQCAQWPAISIEFKNSRTRIRQILLILPELITRSETMRLRFALTFILMGTFMSLPALAQRQWGRPQPPRNGACFYQDADFRGNYFCLKVGEQWPSMPSGFNDRISSIRVFRGARVRIFNDDNFRGIGLRIDQDMNDLSRVRLPQDRSRSWNDRISSIAVYRENDNWDRSHRN
jgi:Peptidase inhibitor family I36